MKRMGQQDFGTTIFALHAVNTLHHTNTDA